MLKALSRTGVPYSSEQFKEAPKDALRQADKNAEDEDVLKKRYGENVNIRDFDGNPEMLSEMDALVAYLQMLGALVDAKSRYSIRQAFPCNNKWNS